MKVCLIGEGAQGETHMQALATMDDVEVVTVAGGKKDDLERFAQKWKIPHYSLNLQECIDQPGVEAVINTGPSQLHFEQTALALNAGKHVLLEIPMALDFEQAKALADLASAKGLQGMVCHTRHFNAPLRELKRRIVAGELHLYHAVFQTYFFRRVNLNRFGQPRTWKDDLLWHHGCHAVDLFAWLVDDPAMSVWGQVGPNHSELDIPMDLTVGMKAKTKGAIATIAHSFNNHGPIRVPIRFICEEETFLFDSGILTDHEGNELMRCTMQDAVVMQNNEFFSAIRENREAETSFNNCLISMDLLERVQAVIDN